MTMTIKIIEIKPWAPMPAIRPISKLDKDLDGVEVSVIFVVLLSVVLFDVLFDPQIVQSY